MLSIKKVAVIGGGAAGLAAAKELRQEGHRVVVFERESEIGGTWVYNPQTESDPIGSDPNRKVVHSSLYQSLRTNLSREIMGFRDFPFIATGDPKRDSRRYPCHEEVLRYLLDFAHKFKLDELVRYETEVKQIKVRSIRREGNQNEVDEKFDAVVVCKGHYTQPNIAHIPGCTYCNAKTWCKQITSANEDGSVTFDDGNTVFADVILHCTGYKYVFPFLDTLDAVTEDDHRVGPLYKHVFPPAFAPRLSFVGIPWKVLPFPQFELQSKWIAGVLSGRLSLPSKEEMTEDVEAFYSRLDDAGVPKRYTHALGESVFEYLDWLATQCGCAPMEEWRKQMTFTSLKTRMDRFECYRDEWDDIEDLMAIEAQKDFAKYFTDTEDHAHSGVKTQSNGEQAA
ncbi:hypothetical protein V2J09_008036 [Rumex salicifolius]